MRPRHFVGSTLVILLAGCGADEADPGVCTGLASPRVIAPAAGWRQVALGADPFYEGSDAPVSCAPATFGLEAGVDGEWWGIETVQCGYVTFEQPTATALCPGDEVVMRLWHFNLLDNDADFEALLAVDAATPLIRETIPIPADARLVEMRATLVEFVDAGTPLLFHLENHGSNSWGLLDVVVERSR
ncbi:MAG: hypothetical protein ACI81R_000039 [Bradymonadia bacterium]|jgi:hypothetical protein